MEHDEQKDLLAWSMSIFPTTSTVDLSERDNKETRFVKEEETNDAEVFGEEFVVEVMGFLKEPTSSVLRTPRLSPVIKCLPPGLGLHWDERQPRLPLPS